VVKQSQAISFTTDDDGHLHRLPDATPDLIWDSQHPTGRRGLRGALAAAWRRLQPSPRHHPDI
jgi:hypothetical protein